ncbi:MAG: isochorismatase family protein [Caulobacterales bacterium]|nr:isochorismatase family protein [Caulobacterales bacterium]
MSNRFDVVGYGQAPIGFGERPAIIVVDFQVGFTRPEYPAGISPHIHRAVENTAVLLKSARARGVPVAVCNVAWGSERDMSYWKVPMLYRDMFYGDASTAFEPKTYDKDYDFAFTKSAPSMFFGTPLVTFLTKQRVDTVFVTGCTTSGCVRATINDSFSHGFRTMVPEECVGDMEEDAHIANLTDVSRRYADVVTLEASLNYLEKFEVKAAA